MRPSLVFVFGSNLAGRHGAGAAKEAVLHWGARFGLGQGYYGRSFAIPTKDEKIRTLPLERIKVYVDGFLSFARMSPSTMYYVTPIGTGLAGYSHEQIAPMFKGAPDNCMFCPEWLPYVDG